jgi:hypothetical protein
VAAVRRLRHRRRRLDGCDDSGLLARAGSRARRLRSRSIATARVARSQYPMIPEGGVGTHKTSDRDRSLGALCRPGRGRRTTLPRRRRDWAAGAAEALIVMVAIELAFVAGTAGWAASTPPFARDASWPYVRSRHVTSRRATLTGYRNYLCRIQDLDVCVLGGGRTRAALRPYWRTNLRVLRDTAGLTLSSRRTKRVGWWCASRAPVTPEPSGHPETSMDFHGLTAAVQ